MPYLTPSIVTPVTQYVCRRLVFPANFDLLLAIKGAVLELTYPWNWEQFGTSTPEEMAALMSIMYDDFVFSEGCMIGAILPYATTSAPDNTLPCDGSQHERVDYPILYSLLPAALIVDADHFLTPDLRNQFIAGAGDSYVPLETGGAASVTLTTNQMPAHNHTTQPHTHTVTGAAIAADLAGELPEPTGIPSPQITSAEVVLVDSAGGGEAHENRPPFTALNYCIVAR
jgi:microcystin-dependent protein